MGLSILNNIPSLEAQNQLAITNSKLQNTLFQLSSGSKINSGADDPAGLSIANGLQANITALTQSAANVTDGVGLLQTADGALSQVTTLLNRAVTLATEAGNAGLTQGSNSQQMALQNEFGIITGEINQIGTNTTYNDSAVFTGNNMSVFLSDGSSTDQNSASGPTIAVPMPALSAGALGLGTYATGTLDLTGQPQAGNTVTIGTQTYTFEAVASAANQVAISSTSVAQTLQNLQAAVNGLAGAGTAYGSGTSPNGLAQIISVNGGAATVQALQAGTAGNSIPLSAVLTSGAGGVTSPLSGGAAPYGTLQLANQPSTGTYNYGTLTLTGLPHNGDTVTLGPTASPNVYTFVTYGNASNAGDVAIANTGSIATTLANLAGAINGTAGGTTNSYDVLPTTGVTATANGDALTVTTNTLGSAPSGIAFSASITGGLGTVANGGGGANLGGGTNPDTVQIGGDIYTFVAANSAAAEGQVALGANVNGTLNNLAGAVNNGTAGTTATYGNWGTANGAAAISVPTGSSVATVTEVVPATATTTPPVTFTASGTIAGAVGGTSSNLLANGVAAHAVVSLNSTPVVGDTLTLAGETYTFVAAGTATAANEVALGTGSSAAAILLNTMTNLEGAVDGATASGVAAGTGTYGVNTGTNTSVMIPTSGGGAPTVSNGVGTFTVQALTESTAGNSLSIISNLTSGVGGVVGSGTLANGGASASLASASSAQLALVTIENAISTVAGYRGAIGAGINQMNAVLDVINNTSQNLTSSLSGIEDANIGQVISNMSKYQVLEQTGIAALAQSNTSEQAILRLLP
jgi:flagellin